ncbi:MAG: hypothetical protein K1X88_05765 [Nannocystaceae bacterium]|nr:hypothetical protein [Nannocystaceae bacterium]
MQNASDTPDRRVVATHPRARTRLPRPIARAAGLALALATAPWACGDVEPDHPVTTSAGHDSGASGDSTADTTAGCTIGTEGCACTPGGACDDGLSCLSMLCVDAGNQCTAGTEGCPCIGGLTCMSPLVCLSDTCVMPR